MIIKEWEHAGMRCALRHGVYGAPCGYVALPEGHKLHGKDSWTSDCEVVVHCGVTFAGKLRSDELGRFLVGFDMAHFGDFSPIDYTKCIRTYDECTAETNRLAEQLAKMEVKRGSARFAATATSPAMPSAARRTAPGGSARAAR